MTQHNQYDIDFLFQRARMRGYVVFIQEEDQRDRAAPAAVLRPVTGGHDPRRSAT